MGYRKTIMFEKCDVSDIDRTAELLNKYKPDLVYSSVTMLAPQAQTFLPPEISGKLNQISGHLIPAHLTLISKLMKAVKESGTKITRYR